MEFKDYLIFLDCLLGCRCLSSYCSYRVQAGKGFSRLSAGLGPTQNASADIFIQDNDAGDDHCIASCLENTAKFQILPEMCSLTPEQSLASERALKLLSEPLDFM